MQQTQNAPEEGDNSEGRTMTADEKKKQREAKKMEKKQAKEQKGGLSKEERKKLFETNENNKRQERLKAKEEAENITTPTMPSNVTNNSTNPTTSQQTNASDQRLREENERLKKELLQRDKLYLDLKKKYQENRISSHLPEYQPPKQTEINTGKLHPQVIQLGIQYASGQITGCNARTLAMFTVLKQLVNDTEIPEDKQFSRCLDPLVSSVIDHLKQCRPMSVGMKNALRRFKYCLHQIDKESYIRTHQQRKEALSEYVDRYIEERISVPEKEIVKKGVNGIKDGDTILTYALSEVLEKMIIEAAQSKKISVIVVDSRPKNEGKELVKRLTRAGVKCSIVLVNAVTYVMKDVSKVFLGANSILSNGNVYSRVGTAVVAMTAKAFNIPVVVCCETYKFSAHSQLDSITTNELGDPYDLVDLSTTPQRHHTVNYLSSNEIGQLEVEGVTKFDDKETVYNMENFESIPNLHIVNLTYDLTPCHYVDMVLCEFGAIPPTSVSVILREYVDYQ
ncbi:predicted protein [Naegleria gruberi]|uniref:Translation initiation factor eIF2B subunit delta n=1 Tax=Naegleria gruberi TaxID=5762 RepID=D2VX98_NAEGR|nr:uncharacterized protein NAEGRDRAFT_59484 [Naegleria gruberi]EFC38588.1 predicted protein [Naegleria gruberi]|eukprot:XP_002671332.1 predicted protein [Naegleria gruberi strain NEG-M]